MPIFETERSVDSSAFYTWPRLDKVYTKCVQNTMNDICTRLTVNENFPFSSKSTSFKLNTGHDMATLCQLNSKMFTLLFVTFYIFTTYQLILTIMIDCERVILI